MLTFPLQSFSAHFSLFPNASSKNVIFNYGWSAPPCTTFLHFKFPSVSCRLIYTPQTAASHSYFYFSCDRSRLSPNHLWTQNSTSYSLVTVTTAAWRSSHGHSLSYSGCLTAQGISLISLSGINFHNLYLSPLGIRISKHRVKQLYDTYDGKYIPSIYIVPKPQIYSRRSCRSIVTTHSMVHLVGFVPFHRLVQGTIL